MSRFALNTLSLTSKANEAASTLGQNIRQAQLRRNMRQTDLAKPLGVSPVTIGKLEKGIPSVGFGGVIAALDMFDLVDSLTLVANTEHDSLGKILEQKRP